MLRKADILDDTYEPYHPGKVLSEEANGELGAVNLLAYPYLHTTRVHNGVTFTDNGDGTVTANGTATAEAIFTFSDKNKNAQCLNNLIGKKIKFWGGIPSDIGVRLQLWATGGVIKTDEDTPNDFILPDLTQYDSWNFTLIVSNGTTNVDHGFNL